MPRAPREFSAGVYHVAAHGSADRLLFLDDTDRRAFLDLLELTWAKLGLELISYVLMTNHYHVLTWIPDKRLAQALQMLHGRYSLRHNKRHGSAAHLFRAHCLARRLRDSDDLLTSERYLARNPVDASIVMHPLDWPWSSARHHAGLQTTAVLEEKRLRGAFGGRTNWRERYVSFIAA
jgi:REP-associated tyrosine transposase